MNFECNSSNVASPQDARREGQKELMNGNFLNATKLLTQAIHYKNRAQFSTEDVINLYMERCESYLGLANLFLTRNATWSENAALFGPDPMMLATLTLKDVDHALGAAYSISCSPLIHANLQYLKGKSLQMLERYSDAENAYLEGLQASFEHEKINQALNELRKFLEENATVGNTMKHSFEASEGSRQVQRSDELDCAVCSRLLFEPVTTTCGHTFCKACLEQAIDHSQRCPMCRTVIYLFQGSLSVSMTLKAILQKNFEAEYRERAEESAISRTDQSTILPLFVHDVVLPRQRLALHIFEPRYRLMIRRCMEGSRIFGISGRNADGSLLEETCACEIKEFTPLTDGRYEIEVVAFQVHVIQSAWEQDGYRVARVTSRRDALDDGAASSGESLADNSMDFTNPVQADRVDECKRLGHEALALMNKAMQKISITLEKESATQIIERCGAKPGADDFVGISWYAANLISHRSRELSHQFLREASVKKRLKIGIDILKAMEESPQVMPSPQCSLM